MNTTSESLLLRLKRANDNDAWSEFVRLYTPLIFFWARKSGLQSQDASDLTQEVLTLLFRKLPDFEYDSDKSFRAWLRTVSMNRFRDWFKRKSLEVADLSHSSLAQIADPGTARDTWDKSYEESLIASGMEIVKHDFQEKTWKALSEFILSDKSATEVAQKHGVSEWTIYSAKGRLKNRLRVVLEGLME